MAKKRKLLIAPAEQIVRRATVLVITRYLAPGSAVGGKRLSFLCREWQALGLDVRVVTGPVDERDGIDPSLPKLDHVIHCKSYLRLPLRGHGVLIRAINKTSRILLSPVDMEVFWIRPVVQAAASVIQRSGSGLVVATIPPFSAAIAAAHLAKTSGWPLILDYRDPWTGYAWPHKFVGRYDRGIGRWLEGQCITHSAARVFNTPEMRQYFEEFFPHARRDRNFVIPNGLDALPREDNVNTDNSAIVHAGALYGDRSVVPVLRSLDRLMRRRGDLAGTRIVVYGEICEAEATRVKHAKLGHILELRPRIARDALQIELRRAKVLLVVSGEQMGYSVPYKLYDYLAARRPILALVKPESAVARFLRQYDVGEYADPIDEAAQEQALERLLLSRGSPPIGDEVIEAHLWSTLARRYSQLFEDIATDASMEAPKLNKLARRGRLADT
ncbi:MAG: glycosyltransferase [Gammaproteobacteria bacterium]